MDTKHFTLSFVIRNRKKGPDLSGLPGPGRVQDVSKNSIASIHGGGVQVAQESSESELTLLPILTYYEIINIFNIITSYHQ